MIYVEYARKVLLSDVLSTLILQNEEPFKYDHPRLPFDEGDADADSCVAYKFVSLIFLRVFLSAW